MKRHSILILLAGVVAIASAQIIPEAPPEPKSVAQLIADDLTDGVNPELNRRIEYFKNCWETTWENPRETPDNIVQAMSVKAGRFFLAGHIERVYFQGIAQQTGTTFEALIGSNKYAEPLHPVTVNPDGTASVDMPEEGNE